MSHAAPRTNQTPFTLPTGPGGCADWRTGEARGACCTAAGSECHAGVTSSSQRSEAERGEGGGQHRGRLPTAVSHGWAAPTQTGNHIAPLPGSNQILSTSGCGKRIDSVSVSNDTARITVSAQHAARSTQAGRGGHEERLHSSNGRARARRIHAVGAGTRLIFGDLGRHKGRPENIVLVRPIWTDEVPTFWIPEPWVQRSLERARLFRTNEVSIRLGAGRRRTSLRGNRMAEGWWPLVGGPSALVSLSFFFSPRKNLELCCAGVCPVPARGNGGVRPLAAAGVPDVPLTPRLHPLPSLEVQLGEWLEWESGSSGRVGAFPRVRVCRCNLAGCIAPSVGCLKRNRWADSFSWLFGRPSVAVGRFSAIVCHGCFCFLWQSRSPPPPLRNPTSALFEAVTWPQTLDCLQTPSPAMQQQHATPMHCQVPSVCPALDALRRHIGLPELR